MSLCIVVDGVEFFKRLAPRLLPCQCGMCVHCLRVVFFVTLRFPGWYTDASALAGTDLAFDSERHEYGCSHRFHRFVHTQTLCSPEVGYSCQAPLKVLFLRKFTPLKTPVTIIMIVSSQTLIIFSFIARMPAQELRSNPTTTGLLAHTGCGAVILAILLITLYVCERDAFLYLSKHNKSD